MAINISYGAGNSITHDLNGFQVVRDIVGNANIMGVLGATAGAIDVRVNGAAATPETRLLDGDSVQFISRANSKA